MLEQAGLRNAEIRELAIEDFVPAVAAMPDESFDLVVVDHGVLHHNNFKHPFVWRWRQQWSLTFTPATAALAILNCT